MKWLNFVLRQCPTNKQPENNRFYLFGSVPDILYVRTGTNQNIISPLCDTTILNRNFNFPRKRTKILAFFRIFGIKINYLNSNEKNIKKLFLR